MKILIIPSWYPTLQNPISGVFFKEQAQALQKAGHDVIVVYPELWSIRTLGKQSQKSGVDFNYEDGIPTYRYRGYNYIPRSQFFYKILFKRRLAVLIKLALKEYWEPDIIHAHSCIFGGVLASDISIKEGWPLVITEHSTAFSRDLLNKTQKRLIKKALNQAKEVIVVGPGLKKELQLYTKVDKISIIPNIVNINKFQIGKEYLKNSKFRFFSLGLLEHKKGMDILINAFSEIHHNNTELVIGGDGEDREKLENLAIDLGISGRVKFLGRLDRDEVKMQMSSCNVFVLSSRHETFGVVFIEALASGKPIIASKTGGPDFIVNNKNGLLVPVEDVASLRDAMDEIIDNYLTYDPVEIRNDCIRRFSEESVVKELNKIYSHALQ